MSFTLRRFLIKRLLQIIINSLLLSFILFNFSFAQSGKISGRVIVATTDEALPFVNVLILGTTQSAAADIDGYYVIIGVSPGTYSVKSFAIGYNSVTTENVQMYKITTLNGLTN